MYMQGNVAKNETFLKQREGISTNNTACICIIFILYTQNRKKNEGTGVQDPRRLGIIITYIVIANLALDIQSCNIELLELYT